MYVYLVWNSVKMSLTNLANGIPLFVFWSVFITNKKTFDELKHL